jgi:hypothetical protein
MDEKLCRKCGKDLDSPDVEGLVYSHHVWWCCGCFAEDMKTFENPENEEKKWEQQM